MNQNNDIRKFDKWTRTVISLVAIMSVFIGAVAGMAIKSQRIDDNHERSVKNEKSIQEVREIMIRIDENLKFIRTQIEEMKDDDS